MDQDAKRWLYWTIPIVVVVGAGVAIYYGRQHGDQQPEPTAEVQAPSTVAPPVQHPIAGDAPSAQHLPPLNESDREVQESLSGVVGRSLEQLLVPKDIIRHTVVTIDNLPRKKTAVQLWPVKPVGGELAVSGAGEPTLSEQNADRYEPFVKILQNTDMTQLAALYKRFYPLFQEAYVDLGYPDGYFNDRLVEVIDHLLATPEVIGPVKLTQPGVFYQYADPSLEERSAGQKLLIRLGNDNAATVKAKLRQLREEVAKQRR